MAGTSLNPLAEVTKKKDFFARTLRTTLKQKLWAAYDFFAGEVPLLSEKPRLGLFDYLLLLIPRLFSAFFMWSLDRTHTNAGVFFLVTTAILNIPFLIARSAFSATMTLVTSPITALVHLFSTHIGREDKEKILKITGKTSSGKTTTFESYLQENKLNLADLNATMEEESSSKSADTKTTSNYQLTFWGEVKKTKSERFSISMKKDQLSASQHSLFRYNVGDIKHIKDVEAASLAKPS